MGLFDKIKSVDVGAIDLKSLLNASELNTVSGFFENLAKMDGSKEHKQAAKRAKGGSILPQDLRWVITGLTESIKNKKLCGIPADAESALLEKLSGLKK